MKTDLCLISCSFNQMQHYDFEPKVEYNIYIMDNQYDWYIQICIFAKSVRFNCVFVPLRLRIVSFLRVG